MISGCDEVLIALRRIMRATDLHSAQVRKRAGMTTPQLLVMQAIARLGEVPISALAREVSLSQATVTAILDRLAKQALVFRQRSAADKRRVHAYLTDLGRVRLQQAPEPLQASFVQAFSALESWEQHMICASLQRVAAMMDANDLEVEPVLHAGELDASAVPFGNDLERSA